MQHFLIAVALGAFIGLELLFVHYSPTPPAALTFAALVFIIMLLLSVTAGGYVDEPEDYSRRFGPFLGAGLPGFLGRALLASGIPILLALAVAYLPALESPLRASPLIAFGVNLAIFWLFGALALAGAVLGFLWPRTGAFESVVMGGLVVLAQSLISWARVNASRDELQLALYNLMIWVSVCLAGAWVGLILRQISDSYLFQAGADASSAPPASASPPSPAAAPPPLLEEREVLPASQPQPASPPEPARDGE